MPKVSVYNQEGKEVSQMNLSDSVFGITPNKAVLHMVVKNYLANQRQGTQSTRTRSEVQGGGKKPWRQKGTGHARQGSIRAPQWVHGGVALGPKPRSYRYRLNKKVKRLALKSALSAKCAEKELILLDKLSMKEYKTKEMISVLKKLNVEKKALIVLEQPDQKVFKSTTNIPGIQTTQVGQLNVYDILNHDQLILLQSAATKLEEVYAS